MSNEIGSYDAKTKLPEILRRVESGETFTITNRGKAIADLVPSRNSSRVKTANTIRAILADQQQSRSKSMSDARLRTLKTNGRK